MNEDPVADTAPTTEIVIETQMDPRLNELIHQLANWRKQGVVSTEHLNELSKKLEDNKDFQLWKQLHKEAMDKTTSIRVEIEKITREIYDQFLYPDTKIPNKHPHPAITVKVFIEPYYKEEDAHAWCMDHLPKALKLDSTFFNRHAEAVRNTAPLEFVQFVPKLSVQIKSDLAEFEKDVKPT